MKIDKKNKRGISVLYVVFVTSILLAIALGISLILIQQIRMMGDIGYSVAAFYAADTGIERALMLKDNPMGLDEEYKELGNEASYKIYVNEKGGNGCQADSFCIRSIGFYRGIRRAIEVKY